MADDFEAGAGSSPGGPGPSSPVVGLSRRHRTNEEKLQDMRRHLRTQEERHKKSERMKRAREREMASKWVEHDKAKKEAKEEELKQRLAHLARQEHRAAERKAQKAEAGAAARTTIPSGGSANGGGLPGARNEAEATSNSAGGGLATAAPSGADRERSPGREHSRERSPGDKDSPRSPKASPRLSPGSGGGVRSWRVRKKKRDEGLAHSVVTPRALQIAAQQRSIMQEVQEMCPGLNKSMAGREILAAGTRNEKSIRDALVKGDLGALQEVEKQAEMSAEEEAVPLSWDERLKRMAANLSSPSVQEKEAEVQEQPRVSHKHMARRYRLRMMNQIQAQVLQCRKKMALNFKQSLISPRGLGCSPHVEADESPRSIMSNSWMPD